MFHEQDVLWSEAPDSCIKPSKSVFVAILKGQGKVLPDLFFVGKSFIIKRVPILAGLERRLQTNQVKRALRMSVFGRGKFDFSEVLDVFERGVSLDSGDGLAAYF